MRSGSIPARRVELVGRGADLDAAVDLLLHGDGRLLTLTGSAGVGKTSLGLELARRVEADVPDGAWVVDLAITPAEASPEDVARACVRALGGLDERRQPLDAVIDHLQVRQGLLVLDNCEHLAEAVARVADRLLDTCPYLRLLVTSRGRLGVTGEAVYVVQPLAAPLPGIALPELATTDSVRLFTARAAAVDPAFRLDPVNADAVASICRRLEGIPLAIELAAAHAGALSPSDIEGRLGLQDGLLERGGTTGADRQQTLQAAIAWSHELLPPDQQALFRRLAVFTGSWTLAAAEAVCGLGAPAGTVASGLAALVGQSLVLRESEGQLARYRFLVPIAEYAGDRLAASPERDVVAAAHAGWVLGVVGAREQGTPFAVPADLDRIDSVADDAHAALRWALAAGQLELAGALAASMLEWWRVRGHLRDLLVHVDALLAVIGAMDSIPAATLVAARADAYRLLGRLDEAEADANAAFAMATRLGDAIHQRASAALLGDITAARGDIGEAIRRYDEAADAFPMPAAGVIPAFWHANRGLIGLRGGPALAESAHADLTRALELLGEGQRTWYLGRVLASLGASERRRGDLAAARTHLEAGFVELLAYGARVDAIGCLEELALATLDARDPSRSTALLAAASGLRAELGIEPDETENARRLAGIEQARAALGAARFDAAWASGRTLTFAGAGALAIGRRPLESPAPGTGPSPWIDLTAREREVAALVAEGLTNPQIAERLFISVGTARTHVERILGKLGLTSRVQVARRYADHAVDAADAADAAADAGQPGRTARKSVT